MSAERGTGPQSALDAAYLHARAPGDARIAFWCNDADVAAALPADLRARGAPVEFQLLVPVEESSLRPVASNGSTDEDDRAAVRVAPSLWTIPAFGVPLGDAVPWLATLDLEASSPTLRALAAASRLVLALRDRGDFAPA